MTDKSDLIAAFVSKRLNDNLVSLKKYFPDLHQEFYNYKEKRYILVYDQDGNVNLFDQKTKILVYERNPLVQILNNLSAYEKAPICRPYFVISNSDNVSDESSNELDTHSLFMNKLGLAQLDLVKSAGESLMDGFYAEDTDNISERFGLPKDINGFICLSVGLGFDLEKLYFGRNIRRLFILEPDSDVFYASLQLIDWGAIFDKCFSQGYRIYIGISDDVDDMMKSFMTEVGLVGRHNIAGSYLYSSFYKVEYKALFDAVKEYSDIKFFSGFGFYNDARNSVAHSLSNFSNSVPCIKVDAAINKVFGQDKVPVFIVGNGPSLDSEMDFIKRNSDSVVIVSCGSSLSSLLNNGVVPDFHIELERNADITHWLDRTLSIPVYGDICREKTIYIGMSQVHPESFSRFETKGQMPKDVEAGSLILRKVLRNKGVPLVGRVAPSCVHTGITFSVISGFKKIYMFGVDMGYRDLNYHHSKHSIYEFLNDESAKRFAPPEKNQITYKSNFGDDKIFSSGFFPFFKNELESIIKAWSYTFEDRVRFYNCSDGALIDGAEPIRSYDIEIPHSICCKYDIVRSVYESLFAYVPSPEDVSLVDDYICSSIHKLKNMSDWLVGKIKCVESISEATMIIDELSYGFHSKYAEMGLDEEDSWLYSLFDGSLLYSLSAINAMLYFPCDESIRLDFFNKSVSVMEEFFVNVYEDFSTNYKVGDSETGYNYF